MASPAPPPADHAHAHAHAHPHARPSFAKVAASALRAPPSKDHSQKEHAPKPTPPVATPKTLAQPSSMRPAPPALAQRNGTDAKPANTPSHAPQWTDAVQDVPDRPRSIALAKVSAAEDTTTQLSSSDGSGKPPSIDGKSIASTTTFALDEKESLRPDDSASLRAVEEEDVTSPPDSVVADSRHGSDNGSARAFRDQLHEIAVMNPQSQRGPPGRFPPPTGPHALYDPNQPPNGARPMSQPVGSMPPIIGVPNMPASPDEKLIEALQSPRDRLFVVKIEQDFIDFIKDSRESEYSLPNCNTFYRMLAHRLADYYLLGHVVDSTMTGVKITRTPYCRIPPPLSQMVDATKGADTPPVDVPARKIMRREDAKSGTNTTSNSQNPSKSASEVGGSDSGNEKEKGAMTREEREQRYREARQRIFGAESEEAENNETNGEDKDKDASRSSSASGKKKNAKKQRNYDDDDFQARSRFNAYYSQQYPASGYSGDNVVYYSGYQGPAPPQFPGVNPGASPPPNYTNPYPVMVSPEVQSQYGWSGQPYQPQYPGYEQMPSGYDLPSDFQRGMSSFQNAGPSQVTPKMANPPMAPYQDSYPQSHMPTNPAWPQMSPQPSYPMSQPSFPPNAGNRPMSAPQQAPMPGQYQYGQFPPNAYNGKPNRNQHPIPGSYNRQQFNPQSQAFIPGGRNMPFQMPPNMGGPNMHGMPPMNGYGQFPMPGPTMPRMSPSAGSTPSFGSPQSMHGNSAAMNRIASQNGEQAQSRIPSAASSIAKYGTPSHLPAKPPAPLQAPAPKFDLPALGRGMAPGGFGAPN